MPVSVPIGTGQDTFAPDREGDWTIEADFQNGQVVRRTLTVSFFVLPESPIGALAMAAGSMGTLGLSSTLEYGKSQRSRAH